MDHVPAIDLIHDERGLCHEILRVTLRSGEAFIVDLSGAQHGYYDPITTWTEYRDNRIKNIISIPPTMQPYRLVDVDRIDFRKWLLLRKNFAQKSDTLYMEMMRRMNLHMVEGFILRDMHHDKGLTGLWELLEEDFWKELEDLVQFMEWRWHDKQAGQPYQTANGRRLLEVMEGKPKWERFKE